jgi:hypothetical protein
MEGWHGWPASDIKEDQNKEKNCYYTVQLKSEVEYLAELTQSMKNLNGLIKETMHTESTILSPVEINLEPRGTSPSG